MNSSDYRLSLLQYKKNQNINKYTNQQKITGNMKLRYPIL